VRLALEAPRTLLDIARGREKLGYGVPAMLRARMTECSPSPFARHFSKMVTSSSGTPLPSFSYLAPTLKLVGPASGAAPDDADPASPSPTW